MVNKEINKKLKVFSFSESVLSSNFCHLFLLQISLSAVSHACAEQEEGREEETERQDDDDLGQRPEVREE